MSVPAPICIRPGCKHFYRDRPGMTCRAFPDGIPADIIDGIIEHRQPIEGDNGIVFEQIEEEADLATIWEAARKARGHG